MKQRRLGGTALHVTEICLGTMTFGSMTDEKESPAPKPTPRPPRRPDPELISYIERGSKESGRGTGRRIRVRRN